MRLVEPTAASPAAAPASPWRAGLIRPKGNLSKTQVSLLLLVAAVPLLMVVIRIMALPGVLGPGLSETGIPAIGNTLTQMLSLQSVPSGDRDRVLYLLLLPMCAVLLTVARLTLGIRVIGFRSILIAMGFQASGIVPSLVLIAVVISVLLLVRPVLIRMRLPSYARICVILCIVVMTLLGAMLVGPGMRSEVLWRVAFFPVIVLGLLAEGIAKILDRDSGLTAAWRAGMTIGIAFLLALICQIPALREFAIQFPELVVTQIVAIVLISEFLDLRLLQDWDSKLSGMALPRLLSNDRAHRVAVVRNRKKKGVIGHLGPPSPSVYDRRSIRRIADALREAGHTVKVIEGDMNLLSELSDFIPTNPRTGQPGGIVLNLSHGIQGDAQYTHVPAMLEMSGVAYTGPTPRGHALAFDRVVAKTLLEEAGVPTPAFRVMTGSNGREIGLRYPLTVTPRHEPSHRTAIVRNRRKLEDAVDVVVRKFRQQAVVEEHVSGREIQVAVLGNDPVECLPLVELKSRKHKMVCPAPLDEALAHRIREAAKAAFRACECRDYARVDIRVGRSGSPHVVGITSIGILEQDGSFELAAKQAGYTFRDLICRIIEVARRRYLSEGAVRSVVVGPVLHASGSAKGRTVVAG
jgi:D-alanine-D-alanine ligase